MWLPPFNSILPTPSYSFMQIRTFSPPNSTIVGATYIINTADPELMSVNGKTVTWNGKYGSQGLTVTETLTLNKWNSRNMDW